MEEKQNKEEELRKYCIETAFSIMLRAGMNNVMYDVDVPKCIEKAEQIYKYIKKGR